MYLFHIKIYFSSFEAGNYVSNSSFEWTKNRSGQFSRTRVKPGTTWRVCKLWAPGTVRGSRRGRIHLCPTWSYLLCLNPGDPDGLPWRSKCKLPVSAVHRINVVDGDPTLNQHWISVPFWLGGIHMSQQTWDIEPMLGWCWPIIYDAGPTSTQHRFNVACLLGYNHTISWCLYSNQTWKNGSKIRKWMPLHVTYSSYIHNKILLYEFHKQNILE